MGDTADSLGTGGGQYCWVVAIEGFEHLLTNGPTAAVLTAWAATPWSQALPGLEVSGEFEQSIKPWSADLTPGELTLRVVPDANDTLGIALHKGGAGNETYLEDSFDANDTTFDVLDAGVFSIPGDVYVGLERIDTASETTNTITVDNRGIYAPFNVDGASTHRWGRSHTLTSVDYGVNSKSIVSDQPRAWIGKWVGLWLHRIAGGVVDTKAEAELIFAGKLEAYSDTSDGATILECVDAREVLKTTSLLDDQWRARVAEGMVFGVDITWTAHLDYIESGGDNGTATATAMTMPAGQYTLDDILSALNDWFANDAALTAVGSWNVGLYTGPYGERVRFTVDLATGYGAGRISLSTDRFLWQFLGWDTEVGDDNSKSGSWAAAPSMILPAEPYTTMAYINVAWGTGYSLPLEGERGTWFNNTTWLPSKLRARTAPGESWGLVQVGDDATCLAEYTDGTELLNPFEVTELSSRPDSPWKVVGARLSESRRIEVKQVVSIEGTFLDIVARFFAITGADGYNHATYDDGDWGAQLGAAIPWEILGAPFLRTLQSLSESSHQQGMTVTLEKPTLLWDVIKSDLILRAAWLVWRSGTFEFVSPQTPNSSVAIHTLTEANKASAETADTQRTPVQTTKKYLRNILKLEWERDFTGDGDKYLRTATVVYRSSIDDYGEAAPVTIKARNASGEVAASLAADLITTVMPMYGHPLHIMQRSIALSLYAGMAPGDVVAVSDNYARDPADGTRGITLKPGMVLRHSCSYGGNGGDMVGEVDVLFQDIDRAAVYSPTALVSSYAASVFTCAAHEYSETTEAVDASHFVSGDKIVVLEYDADDPASPQTLVTSVASVAGNDITTDDAFPGYDSGKTYIIVSDDYVTAAATQRADCYLADSGDGQILDSSLSRSYGAHSAEVSWTASAPTELAARPANVMGTEGEPVSVGYSQAAARNVNNLISYSTATQGPHMFDSALTGVDTGFVVMACYPYFVGPGFVGDAQIVRKLTVAPLMKAGIVSEEVQVRVTIGDKPPTGGIFTAAFSGRYRQMTFTSSSTTYATATPQTCDAIYNPSTGVGWVTVEGANYGEGSDLSCWGLSEFWLGPLEGV